VTFHFVLIIQNISVSFLFSGAEIDVAITIAFFMNLSIAVLLIPILALLRARSMSSNSTRITNNSPSTPFYATHATHGTAVGPVVGIDVHSISGHGLTTDLLELDVKFAHVEGEELPVYDYSTEMMIKEKDRQSRRFK
jgi:hypothetical protein